ncbi:MAG: tyrosine-type recombinase/integrase [Pseudomonadota bacterium]|uniref:Tyrosine-type recombinase/integrase n=1 Tax=Candidatus Desulfatibia profunda TaxID=2841695 RepID=A0A8J6NW32_9BACT|nr:tyrosine-type recombinase/integrase [Candidatus Desulfatibia profunda]
MIDKHVIESIEWIEKQLEQVGLTVNALERAVADYLQWMESVGYRRQTRRNYHRQLDQFIRFIKQSRLGWDEIFKLQTLRRFKKVHAVAATHSITGISRYLFRQNKIPQPIAKKEYRLPQIYEDYLAHHQRSHGIAYQQIKRIKRVFTALHAYLQRHKINLSSLTIEQIDTFLVEFFAPFTPATCKTYRSMIRGFLRYLYQERKIIKRNLAPLVVGAPMFAKAKPPKFLRPQEVQGIFAGLKLSSSKDIRTCAMVHLAYTLGLRPQEISRISLDDISFTKKELTLRTRKSDNPIKLPLPDITIKTIAAYLVGVRPESKHRILFLSLKVPHGPLCPGVVGQYVSQCIKAIHPSSTAYWLRHTYAQNLLEAGVSIYEIKEMLGHDSIEATRKYLHIHIKLMRKVLFDEEL